MQFKVGLVLEKSLAKSLFSPEGIKILGQIATVNPIEELPEKITREYMMEQLQDADVAVTCWRTPSFTTEMLEALPRLRLVAHGAGSVKNLIPLDFFNGSRRVFSNAPVIAEDVAQTTLALILTSLKQIWQFNDMTHQGGWKGGESGSFSMKRLDGLNVGLVGASLVGRAVIRYLKLFNCVIYMYDPYLSALEAEELGVHLLPLEQLLKTCDVVSLHAPANEDCRHLLNAGNLSLMKNGALLINTARGMLIDEKALVQELETGRIFACLDVTDPEPPAEESKLRTLKNVVLTPHIAGGHTMNGRRMMGRNVVMEVYNFLTTGRLKHEFHRDMFSHMA